MRLKEYIDSHGIKYPFVANKIGVSLAQLYRMFEGKVDPKASVVQKLKEWSQMDVEYIDGWILIIDPEEIKKKLKKK